MPWMTPAQASVSDASPSWAPRLQKASGHRRIVEARMCPLHVHPAPMPEAPPPRATRTWVKRWQAGIGGDGEDRCMRCLAPACLQDSVWPRRRPRGFSAGFGSLTMAAKGSLRPKRGIAVARRGHVPHVAHAPIARSGPEAGRGTGHGTGMFLETRAGAGSCFVEMSESLLRRIRLRSRTAASRHHDLHWQCQACFWGQMGCRRFG